MEWVRNNRFLAGFIGVMVIGVGVLGFLLYTSYSHAAQVDSDYDAQVTELKRLQNLQPYPEEANLKNYADQNKAFAAAVNDLQAQLASMEPPVDKSLSPSEFQSRLRDVVRDLSRAALQVGLALPDANYYFGFEQYRDALPDATAVPLLNSQLSAIDQIMRILIQKRADKLNAVKRAPLPQEGSAAKDPAEATQGNNPNARKGAATAPLVTRENIEIDFTAAPSAFREALNEIVKANRLLVVRALQVKNQVQTGPTRGSGLDPSKPNGGAANGFPAAPTNVDGGTASGTDLPKEGPPPLRYVVGQEKVDVIARIELTKVAPAPLTGLTFIPSFPSTSNPPYLS